jgi:hypothetical protein
MKTISIIATLAVICANFAPANAATNIVVLGQSVQSVIDASSPGDTLLIQPGVYTDASVIFNKPVTVAPSNTTNGPVSFQGAVQIQGSGPSTFQHLYFASDMQISGPSTTFFNSLFNGNVLVSGGKTNGFFDSIFNSNLTATDGKIILKRVLVGNYLGLTNTSLEALRLTNQNSINGHSDTGSNNTFIAVQCSFSGPYNSEVLLSGYKSWFGYNQLSLGLQQFTCDSVLIGNHFQGGSPQITGSLIYSNGGTLKAYNNLINGGYSTFSGTIPTGSSETFLLFLDGNSGEIVNNTFDVSLSSDGATDRIIAINNSTGPVIVKANILEGAEKSGNSFAPIQAWGSAQQNTFFSYCDTFVVGPNIASTNAINVIPPQVNNLIQVDPGLAADHTPAAGSPCLNAGPPEPIYNNRDGTRNTIGFTGGPFFNPANYTNNAPMVFLLTGAQTLSKGAQTTITVNAAATAGH